MAEKDPTTQAWSAGCLLHSRRLDPLKLDLEPTSVITSFCSSGAVQTPQGYHFGELEIQPFHSPHPLKISAVQSPITTYFLGRKDHKAV